MSYREKIVGILGGMGPEATVDFMQRVIRLTPAADDEDHIRMVVDNNPKIPSRIKAIIEKSGQDPAPTLIKMAQKLEKYGADFLVIPCNTAHYYFEKIQTAVSIPVLNMVELTIDKIIEEIPHVKKIGLLASTAVLMTGLFEKYALRRNVLIANPEASIQEEVLAAIRHIKAGQIGDAEMNAAKKAGDSLCKAGVEAIIIGCTELSIIAPHLSFSVPVFDSAQILAEKTVAAAKS